MMSGTKNAFFTAMIVVLALCAGTLKTAQAALEIGKPAPDFTGRDTGGHDVTLSDYKGKLVVLEWTNHGCPFVEKHYGTNNMQDLQKKYTAQDVVWLSVISSAEGKQGHVSDEEANELTKTRGAAPTAVIRDASGDIGRLYGAKTTPHMFIVGKDGNLAYAGAIDSVPYADPEDVATATNYVDVALTELIAGKEVSTPSTRPYGCGVKY